MVLNMASGIKRRSYICVCVCVHRAVSEVIRKWLETRRKKSGTLETKLTQLVD